MALYQQSFSVFSTYVEVILYLKWSDQHATSFLHVCGGDPDAIYIVPNKKEFSPRMWR